MRKHWHVVRDEFGCELWLGRLSRDGYAAINGTLRAVHLLRWEHEVGPIPEGTRLDHMCRRRHCIAIHHLEPVTPGENERRKIWRHRLRPKCRVGHDLRLQSVITPEGGRVCRMCNQIARLSDKLTKSQSDPV